MAEVLYVQVFPTEVYCRFGWLKPEVDIWIVSRVNVNVAEDECIDTSTKVYIWNGSKWLFLCGRDISCNMYGPAKSGAEFTTSLKCEMLECREFTKLPIKTRLKIEVKYWKFKVTEVHDYTKPPLASDVKYVEILVKPLETLKSEIKIDKTKIVKGETINISIKLSKQSVM